MLVEIRRPRENVARNCRCCQGYAARRADLAITSPRVAVDPSMQAQSREVLQTRPEIRRKITATCDGMAAHRGKVRGFAAKCGGPVAISAHLVILAPEDLKRGGACEHAPRR